MAKNYFTNEQIRAVILKKLEANGVDTTEAINNPSEEAIAHLKEFVNLAVEVAIMEADIEGLNERLAKFDEMNKQKPLNLDIKYDI